jgi:hypothetical protein
MAAVQKNQKRITNPDKVKAVLGLTNRAAYHWEGIQPVFIVSTGRTGTTFLARLLQQHPSVYGCHEPRPSLRTLGLDFVYGKTSHTAAGRAFRRWRSPYAHYCRIHDCRFYIEANNYLFSLVDVIRNVIPHARFIHIVRDGRDYVRSALSRNWYHPQDYTYRLQASLFPADPYASQWQNMSRFEKICWEWQKKDSLILSATQDAPDTLHVTFESMFDDPSCTGLIRVLTFIGIDDEMVRQKALSSIAHKHNAMPRYAVPRWQEWTARQKEIFERIAGAYYRRRLGALTW